MDSIWYWIGQPWEILLGLIVIGGVIFYEYKKQQWQQKQNKKIVEKYAEAASKRLGRKVLKKKRPIASDGDEYIETVVTEPKETEIESFDIVGQASEVDLLGGLDEDDLLNGVDEKDL